MNDHVDQRSEIERLLEFLRERNAPCPRCGYNLRNLTQPTCPECSAGLMLKVGLQHPVVHWLLLTLAPSILRGPCRSGHGDSGMPRDHAAAVERFNAVD